MGERATVDMAQPRSVASVTSQLRRRLAHAANFTGNCTTYVETPASEVYPDAAEAEFAAGADGDEPMIKICAGLGHGNEYTQPYTDRFRLAHEYVFDIVAGSVCGLCVLTCLYVYFCSHRSEQKNSAGANSSAGEDGGP